jgi:peptidoglycan/LPS O-acetylase OafA/YrhL
LFLANMAHLFGIQATLSPLWSLAVEEHFYLIWPWVIRALRMRTVAVISVLLICVEPLVRLASLDYVYDVYFYSWFRFDGLAWGALLACLVRSRFCTAALLRRAIAVLFAIGSAIIAAGTPFGILHRKTPAGGLLQFTAAEMIFAGFVLFAIAFSGSRAAAPLRSRFLRLTGDLSYCLYIIHFMVRDAYDASVARFGIDLRPGAYLFARVALRAVVVMAASYAIAELSRKYLEQPALRLKRYFSASNPSGTR